MMPTLSEIGENLVHGQLRRQGRERCHAINRLS